MEPQDVQTLRYGARARRRDIVLCAAFAVIAGPLATLLAYNRHRFPEGAALGAMGVCLVAALFTVARWRWSRWARLDALGIAAGNAEGDPVQRLGWSELREIGLERTGALVLRGGDDVLIRLGSDLEELEPVRLAILRRRGPELFRRLKAAFERGEALDFHGPESPPWSAVKGALWGVLAVLPLSLAIGSESPTLGVVFFGAMIPILVHRRLSACERVQLTQDGIVIHRIVTLRVPWTGIVDARLTPISQLVVRDAGGLSVTISPCCSNFVVLQQIVLERAGRTSAGVPSA